MFPDKSKLISLLLTSLVFGGLLLVNVDRAAHATFPVTTSHHGWPLVFLKRTPLEMEFAGANKVPYSWPWPPIEKEQRVFSWMNLTTDLIVGLSIVGITFVISHTVLRQVFPPKKDT